MNHQDLYKFSMGNAQNLFRGDHTSRWAFANRGTEKIGVLAESLKSAFGVKNGKANVPLTVSKDDAEKLVRKDFDRAQCQRWSEMSASKNDLLIEADSQGNLVAECKGPWAESTMFEIPFLSEVQEQWSMYNGWIDDPAVIAEGRKRLAEKVALYNTIPKGDCVFVEMGTRRAFSRAWHREVVEYMANHLVNFGGTSNVGVAFQLGVEPVGTQAHEWFQAGQALCPDLRRVNGYMLRAWHSVYGSTMSMKYGIALTDCLTTDVFLRDFDKFLANIYNGVRHDSGDPIVWADKICSHYKKLSIDPREKTVVFSDSLNPDIVFKILGHFKGMFGKIVFGIGTNWTHDLGVKGLNMVFKMIEFDGLPVAKISDDPGKGMCKDDSYVGFLKMVNDIK